MQKRVYFLFILLPLVLVTSLIGCTHYYTEEDLDDAWQAGYDENTYEEARAYDRGYERGSIEGYDTGYSRGESFGYDRGYQGGFWDGEDEASGSYKAIAEDSYANGYLDGYRDCLNGYTTYYEELQ